MTDLRSPDAETPRKESKNPRVQEFVEKEYQRLREKYSSTDPELLYQQARDKTAARYQLEKVRLELKAAKNEATTDQLTYLLNAKGFSDELKREVIAAKNTDRSFGIIILDANGLKELNDTLGHEEGDKMLKNAAQALEESVRASDVVALDQDKRRVARWGGDEFGVILSGADEAGVEKWWKRAEKSLIEKNINIGAGYTIVRAEELSVPDLDIESFIAKKRHEADTAMYVGKAESKAQNSPKMVKYREGLRSSKAA